MKNIYSKTIGQKHFILSEKLADCFHLTICDVIHGAKVVSKILFPKTLDEASDLILDNSSLLLKPEILIA